MITLNALAHNAWDAGLFALKHISGNEDGLASSMQLHFDDKFMQREAIASTETESAPDMMRTCGSNKETTR